MSLDGPFNEHLIRDSGGLQLGMAVVLLAVALLLLTSVTEPPARAETPRAVPPRPRHGQAHLGDLG